MPKVERRPGHVPARVYTLERAQVGVRPLVTSVVAKSFGPDVQLQVFIRGVECGGRLMVPTGDEAEVVRRLMAPDEAP